MKKALFLSMFSIVFAFAANAAEAGKYYLVTPQSEPLKAGDKIIIASTEYGEAMSTEQRPNNRGVTSVEIDPIENCITFTDNYNSCQVCEIEDYYSYGCFRLKVGDGYLFAASSSSNYLRTSYSASDDSQACTIKINDDSTATITFQGKNTHNELKYNNYNNPHLFSCYLSENTKLNPVAIYRLEDHVRNEDLSDAIFSSSAVRVSCDNSIGSCHWENLGNGRICSVGNESSFAITMSNSRSEMKLAFRVSSTGGVLEYAIDGGEPIEISTSTRDHSIVIPSGSHTVSFTQRGTSSQKTIISNIRVTRNVDDLSGAIIISPDIDAIINNDVADYSWSASGTTLSARGGWSMSDVAVFEITVTSDKTMACSFTLHAGNFSGISCYLDDQLQYSAGSRMSGQLFGIDIPSGTHVLRFSYRPSDDTSHWGWISDMMITAGTPSLRDAIAAPSDLCWSVVNNRSIIPWTASGSTLKSGECDNSQGETFFELSSYSSKFREYSFTIDSYVNAGDVFYYQIDNESPIQFPSNSRQNVTISVPPSEHTVKFGLLSNSYYFSGSYAEISDLTITYADPDVSSYFTFEDGLDCTIVNGSMPFAPTENGTIKSSNDNKAQTTSEVTVKFNNPTNDLIEVELDCAGAYGSDGANYSSHGIEINSYSSRYTIEGHKRLSIGSNIRYISFFNTNYVTQHGGTFEISNVHVRKLRHDDLASVMAIDPGIEVVVDNSGRYPWTIQDDGKSIAGWKDGLTSTSGWTTTYPETKFGMTITQDKPSMLIFNATPSGRYIEYTINDVSATLQSGENRIYIPAGSTTLQFRSEANNGSSYTMLSDIRITRDNEPVPSILTSPEGVTYTIENDVDGYMPWNTTDKMWTVGDLPGASAIRVNVDTPKALLCRFDLGTYFNATVYTDIDGKGSRSHYHNDNNAFMIPAGSHTVEFSYSSYSAGSGSTKPKISYISLEYASDLASDAFTVIGDADVTCKPGTDWVYVDGKLIPLPSNTPNTQNNRPQVSVNVIVPKSCQLSFNWCTNDGGDMICALNGTEVASISSNSPRSATVNLKSGENTITFTSDELYYMPKDTYISDIVVHSTVVDSDDLTDVFSIPQDSRVSLTRQSGSWTNDKGALKLTDSYYDSSLEYQLTTSRTAKLTFYYQAPAQCRNFGIWVSNNSGNVFMNINAGSPATTRTIIVDPGVTTFEIDYYTDYDQTVYESPAIGYFTLEYIEDIPNGEYEENGFTFSKYGPEISLTNIGSISPYYVNTLPGSFRGLDYKVAYSAFSMAQSGDDYYYGLTNYKFNIPQAVYDVPWFAPETIDEWGFTTSTYSLTYILEGKTSPIREGYSYYGNYPKVYAPYANVADLRRQHTKGIKVFALSDFGVKISESGEVQEDNDDYWQPDYYEGYYANFAIISEADRTCAFVGFSNSLDPMDWPSTGSWGEKVIPAKARNYKVEAIDLYALSACYDDYGTQTVILSHATPPAVEASFAEKYGSVKFKLTYDQYEAYINTPVWQDCNLSITPDFVVDNIGYCAKADGTAIVVSYSGYSSAVNIPLTVVNPNNGEQLTVAAIADNVFSRCNIYLKHLEPMALSDTYADHDNSNTYYVPGLAYDTYKADPAWSRLALKYNYDFEADGLRYVIISESECYLHSVGVQTDNINVPSEASDPATGKTYAVTKIHDSAFSSKSSVKNVSIAEGVTGIGDNAFYYCTALESVDLPQSLVTLGNSAFYNCQELTSVKLPDNLTTISSQAFYGCYALTSLEIHESVTSIGNNAFNYCFALTSVKLSSADPAQISVGSSIFYNNIYPTCTLYVPRGSKHLYGAHSTWGKFKNIVEYGTTTSVQGDVNGDGVLSVADVVFACKLILDDAYDEAADVNGDGELSVADVVIIVNLVLSD